MTRWRHGGRSRLRKASTSGWNSGLAGVVDLADVARERFEPLAGKLRSLRIGGRQRRHCLLPVRPKLFQRITKTSLPRKWRDSLTRCAATASLSR
jgi:hypothetical protein